MYIVTFAFFQGFTRTARNTRNSGIGGTNCEPKTSLFFLKIPLCAFLISSLLACYQLICRLASFQKKKKKNYGIVRVPGSAKDVETNSTIVLQKELEFLWGSSLEKIKTRNLLLPYYM